MAQSYIQTPTDGSGKKLDTVTTTTAAQHRQVVTLGAPDTDANVAPVDATAGLKVNLGADNDVTLATLPDTAAGDLAAINTAVSGTITVDLGVNNDVTLAGTVVTDMEDGNSISVMDQTASAVKVLQVDAAGDDATITVGTAGTASADVITVQGIASMTAVKVDNSAVTQPISHAALTNIGAMEYETVAASQTDQVIGATGAAGDYLSHVIISPATAGCGVVTIYDNATALVSFAGGGTTALSNLIPFTIPVGIISTSGAFKITTGANVSCTAVGNFT